MATSYKPFADLFGEVIAKGQEKSDMLLAAKPLVEGLQRAGDGFIVKTEARTLMVGKAALKQLVVDRLGGTYQWVNDSRLSENTIRNYLVDLALAKGSDPLSVRVNGGTIDAVLSEHYSYFDNMRLVTMLAHFMNEGVLPQQLYVHSGYVSAGARELSMRLIAPDHWNFRNGEEYYGGIVFNNNETGQGQLQVVPAIARVSCFNYALAQNTIQKNHRFSSVNEVDEAVKDGIQHITTYAHEMFERMQHMHGVTFEHPEAVFNMVGKNLGLPGYVEDKARKYWYNEGSDPTTWGVLQAITYGTQELQVQKHKTSSVRWSDRQRFEQNIWMWSTDILDRHQQGQDVNEILSSSELIKKSKVLEALRVGIEDREVLRNAIVSIEPEAWAN